MPINSRRQGVTLPAVTFMLATPGRAEPCEYPEKFGVEQPITEGSGASFVWIGSQYGIAWTRPSSPYSDIWFARLSAAGNMIGAAVRVTADGTSDRPSLVWTGTRWGVTWRTLPERLGVGFAILDFGGHPVGDPVWVTAEEQEIQGGPELAWTGAEFAVAWNGNDDVRLARLSPGGRILGETQVDVDIGVLESFVWNGSGFAFVSHDVTRFSFFRADVEGNLINTRRTIGEDERYLPRRDGERRASIVNGARYGS